jgi:hypothetical protein
MWRWCALLPIIGSAACSEYDLRTGLDQGRGAVPDILVDPPALEFGHLRSGEAQVLSFSIQNIGASTLNVADVALGSGLAFTVLGPELELDLEPGEQAPIDVAFAPLGPDAQFGRVLVRSDDPDSPEVPVDLVGYGAFPELAITPASYTFADSVVPCGDDVVLTLENVGQDTLVIDDFGYRSGGQLILEADALRAELPLSLEPGETRPVTVVYTATTAASDTGVLTVMSNDPRGDVTADQSGEGVWVAEAIESFTEAPPPVVDVMLVIDQSSSMEDENTADVEAGIPDLLDQLRGLADWRLLEVTTFDACGRGGVIGPSTANAEQTLTDNAFPGGHELDEQLLELAAKALGQTGPGQCNEGFLRPGALLHVIAISDEPEQSSLPWDRWLDLYATYTGDPSRVVVSAVVDQSGCGAGADGYLQAVGATGGSLLDICGDTWGCPRWRPGCSRASAATCSRTSRIR